MAIWICTESPASSQLTVMESNSQRTQLMTKSKRVAIKST